MARALPVKAEDAFAGIRADAATRKRLSAPAIRTFANISVAWSLNVEEQRGLLGWPANSTFFKYKSGDVGTLPFDTLMRVSLVLGIYKALHILYPEQELADSWVRRPNTNVMFDGRPPLDMMVNGGMDGLYQVRRLLDARRGGQ